MPTRRFPFKGTHKITLRGPDLTQYTRWADRVDRGGTDVDVQGVGILLWTSRYTIRRSTNTASLESAVVGWDMADENGAACKITRIALVPPSRPRYVQLFVERAL